jgi:hypothetical protein
MRTAQTAAVGPVVGDREPVKITRDSIGRAPSFVRDVAMGRRPATDAVRIVRDHFATGKTLVDIEITSHCNTSCKCCLRDARVIGFSTNLTMSPEDVARILDSYKPSSVRAIQLSGNGIGAGAYGLPLAAFVKEQGRQAVHVGGATQLLFGVKGRRWEAESEDVVALFNDYWVRPSAEETPAGASLVEGGCYW